MVKDVCELGDVWSSHWIMNLGSIGFGSLLSLGQTKKRPIGQTVKVGKPKQNYTCINIWSHSTVRAALR